MVDTVSAQKKSVSHRGAVNEQGDQALTGCKVQHADAVVVEVADIQPASQVHQAPRVTKLSLLCGPVVVTRHASPRRGADFVGALVDRMDPVLTVHDIHRAIAGNRSLRTLELPRPRAA